MPTSCCWPPESWKEILLTHNIEAVEHIGHHGLAFGGFDIPDQRGFNVLVYRQFVDQVVCLEHKTDVLFVESGTLFSFSLCTGS